ncbi:iron-siderophore ABC transporter substrate-binding protein [Ancylobacter sonchi]|uniref:iron-siderophore ABC transporter substrate-binding protein n=1 Tax=Ancylobacter sonchi TaxID=1937790 RepID=UPI001BD20403|nr:iron-siderophore ABC transporter substrate-binding protein [Ancylobacter sonchi]MBS7533306.1 iron-siderophore ABC transporter substrate-binding protein [Ancylobacter sonchi]
MTLRAALLACWTALVLLLPPSHAQGSCGGRLIDDPDVLHAPVCVPKDPARIVVLDPTYSLGMGLELGLPIVGAPLSLMSDRVLRDEAMRHGVADLGSYLEPSIERLVVLKPDLIIGSSMADSAYPLLSKLAPTLLISAGNWKSYLSLMAKATGREHRAVELLAAYDARVATLKPHIPDQRVSVVRITPWDFQVYLDASNAYGPFLVLRDVGVRRTDYEKAQGNATLKRPDWEELANLKGDTLLYIVGGANRSDTNGRHEEVTSNPLWRMLPAVEAGRVHRVDAGTWMEFSGVASAHRVLDDIERLIIAKP